SIGPERGKDRAIGGDAFPAVVLAPMPCARSGARSQSRTNPNGHIFCAPCPPERSPPPPRAASCVASSCHAFTVPRDMGLRAGRPPPRGRCTGAWDVSGLAAVEFHRLVRSPL